MRQSFLIQTHNGNANILCTGLQQHMRIDEDRRNWQIQFELIVTSSIDNPEFEKYIPDIYPAELQLNKANTSDKETSFLDLNIFKY